MLAHVHCANAVLLSYLLTVCVEFHCSFLFLVRDNLISFRSAAHGTFLYLPTQQTDWDTRSVAVTGPSS